LLQAGSDDDILKFLKTKDLINSEQNFTFDKLYHTLKKKAFFVKVVDILLSRGIYNEGVMGYATYHQDLQMMKKTFELSLKGDEMSELYNQLGFYF